MYDSAQTPAADVKPEPQRISASSVGECPPIESRLLSDSAHLPVRVSKDIGGLVLAIVTAGVVVFALQWAEKIFMPLLLGILIAYTSNPLVVWLERIKIPLMAGACIAMVAVPGGRAFVTFSLRGQIQAILDQLPAAASKLSVTRLSRRGDNPSTRQKVQAAFKTCDYYGPGGNGGLHAIRFFLDGVGGLGQLPGNRDLRWQVFYHLDDW